MQQAASDKLLDEVERIMEANPDSASKMLSSIPSPEVQATDLTVRKAIENELRGIAQKRSGILYSFDKETHVVEGDYSSSFYDNDKRIGTYEWEKDYLTFNFDGNISKHGFATVDEHTIIFSLDFLEKYKSKYPNASVRDARLDNHLSSLE